MRDFVTVGLLCSTLLLAPSACGDSAEEAREKCEKIGPRCNDGVAINCDVHCDMFADCFTAKTQLTCAGSAECRLEVNEATQEERAYCVAQPETECDTWADYDVCVSATAVATCDLEVGLVVQYECGEVEEGTATVVPYGCESQTNSNQLVCGLASTNTLQDACDRTLELCASTFPDLTMEQCLTEAATLVQDEIDCIMAAETCQEADYCG